MRILQLLLMTAVQSLILNFKLTRRHVREVLPTLGKTFRPVRRKNSASKKKICPLLNLTFWRYLAWELIFKKFGPFSTPFCTKSGQIRPQLCPAAYAATTGQLALLSDKKTKAQLPRYSAHKIRIKLDFHSGLRSIQCQLCKFWLYTVKTFGKRIN